MRRSSGPSNESSFTEYASGADSKSEDEGGNSLMCRKFSSRPARAPWCRRRSVRARFEPSTRISWIRSGREASSRRRSRIGSSAAFSAFASLSFTSTSPTLPARYRAFRSSTSAISGLNTSWYRNTGLPFDGAGHVRPDPLRIGVHRADFLLHAVGVLRQQNGIAEALAHLLAAVEPRKPRHFRQQRLRLDEHIAVETIEPPHHLARQLEVRDLIVADRNEDCAS